MPKILQLTATFIILKCQNLWWTERVLLSKPILQFGHCWCHFRIFTNVGIIGCVNLNATNFAENLQSTAKCDQVFAVCSKNTKFFCGKLQNLVIFALCSKIRQKFRSSPYNLGTFLRFSLKMGKNFAVHCKIYGISHFLFASLFTNFSLFFGEKKRRKKLQGWLKTHDLGT